MQLLLGLKAWLDATVPKLSSKSNLAKVMRNTMGLWEALTGYLHDGSIEIDNNAAARSISVIAIGRRNQLFAGLDAVDDRAAATYSLIEAAKFIRMSPEAYPRDVPAPRSRISALELLGQPIPNPIRMD